MKYFLTGALATFLAVSVAIASEQATYFRVWEGFRKPAITSAEFLNGLPGFMDATLDLYGRKLNQYIVGVPPALSPEIIPDEFALLAFKDKADYDQARNSPEGRVYARSHWQLFSPETSKSLPLSRYSADHPDSLQHHRAYQMLDKPIDWRSGTSVFFIGTRKSGVPKDLFLNRLSRHTRMAAVRMLRHGLRGYIVIANENYEAAFMNWSSEDDMARAFTTEDGKAVMQDAQEIMDTVMWTTGKDASSTSGIAPGSVLKTIPLD